MVGRSRRKTAPLSRGSPRRVMLELAISQNPYFDSLMDGGSRDQKIQEDKITSLSDLRVWQIWRTWGCRIISRKIVHLVRKAVLSLRVSHGSLSVEPGGWGSPGVAELRGSISKLEKSAGPEGPDRCTGQSHAWCVFSFWAARHALSCGCQAWWLRRLDSS